MADKVRAAPYARISMDAAGEEMGVARQLDMARDLITSRGWVEVDAFPDNSISALKGKHRPGYTALCEAIARGEVDHVVVYHLSRLWRNRRERAEGIALFREHRVSITSVRGPDFDMSTAYGAGIADLLGVFDTMESEVKSERVRDQKRQVAESGRFIGGGNRPFGYEIDYDRPAVNPDTGRKQTRRVVSVRPHPVEAEIVRECARRVLAGETLRAVAKDLNERDVRTSLGNPMKPQNVRATLASAVISGRREVISRDSHKGRARPLMGEIVATGQWEALISVDDSDRLRRLLSAPERRKSTVDARKTLLTGIVRCSRCGQPMMSRPRQGVPRYVCNSDAGRPGCGRMNTDGRKTDAWVRDAVIACLDDPAMAARLARRSGADPDLIERVRTDKERLDELGRDRDDPEMGLTRAEYVRRRREILARLEGNETRLQAASQTTALDSFVGTEAEMRERWMAMTDAQRRPVVQSVIECVEVRPPSSAGRFDPERFAPVWIEGSG